MKIRHSFKTKLILSYVLIIVVSSVLTAFFLDRRLEERSLRQVKDSLINQGELISSLVPLQNLKQENIDFLQRHVKLLSLKTKCRLTIVSMRGKVLADSDKLPEEIPFMEDHHNRPEIKEALLGGIGVDTRFSSTLKIDMLYVALPFKEGDKQIGVFRLSLPLENVQKTLLEIKRVIFLSVLLSLCCAFILGSILSSGITKPIKRMILISRQFAEGDFKRRIVKHADDEIGELAVTLNVMAQAIEDKVKLLKDQHQKLSGILDSMIEGVIVVDESERIVSVNPTIERIFGVAHKEIQGKFFLEAIRNNDIADVITAVLNKKEPVCCEINLVLPVKGVFQISATGVYDNDTATGCLVVIHDVTAIRKLETMRRDFVANVSHELKTPLTSIIGFVETLLGGALEDQAHNRQFLKIIQEHAVRLNNLVNDLLALSNLESKEITLSKDACNLKQLFYDVQLGFETVLKERRIRIVNEIPDSLSVSADRGKMTQVATNLIDNAIKFNKENGTVRIYCEKLNGQIKVIIEDAGIGIPEKDIPRIFERFYRVDKARSRDLGGTGLGLSIVKHIIELHGGTVGVESTEGLGSKFFFILS